MYAEDTIAAVATPVGEGAVGIIRVSGPEAERIANKVFVREKASDGKIKSHRLYYGKIRDPRNNTILDEVLLTIMRKPRSYTGEDVVEVHCHGGVFLQRRLLGLFLSLGARHAEAGEFTKRAFLNGRLDLAQAEAVLDLIQARTNIGADLALTQLGGELSRWFSELREELLDMLVQVEAAIDFPEEEIELLQRSELSAKINSLRDKIIEIINTYEWGRLVREGAKVCICGRPNVGKSSLLNALLGEDRVIVTAVPGTTRDVIEESINLGGLPVVVWDTAGVRDTDDQVEKIGVELALKHIKKADAAILVLDGSESVSEEDRRLLSLTKDNKCIIVVNKNDLKQTLNIDDIINLAGKREVVSVSAKRKEGFAHLKRSLRDLLLGADREPMIVLTNLRHKAALISSAEALLEANLALSGLKPTEIVAMNLNIAKENVEEVVGKIPNEEILERIFANFCIGK
jgi:tRNA modification GTPase